MLSNSLSVINKMNKLHNLFDLISKTRIQNDLAPEDLFLAGLVLGGLAQPEH